MKVISDLEVEVLAGQKLSDIVNKPLRPYSKEGIEFLSDLSQSLFRNEFIRTYPDIAAFAYWCRKANLQKLSRGFNGSAHRIGRGLTFHVAPANVPVNFAFSFAFGILAGNANIVRLPSVLHLQVNVICEEIMNLFKMPRHFKIAKMSSLIRYPRRDDITSAISKVCQARILWGGDNTIEHLKLIKSAPRSIDIAFADRYSICVMNAKKVLVSSPEEIKKLVEGFHRDVFFLDQNACSSPHLILWQGDTATVEKAMNVFWEAMSIFLSYNETAPVIHAIEKYLHVCRTAINLDDAINITTHGNLIHRVRLKKVPQNIDTFRGKYGFFFEYISNDLSILKEIVGERYQTLTCFGIDKENVINFILDEGLLGIDRVVQVGKALDIGVVWDGYDLIGTLSRVIIEE